MPDRRAEQGENSVARRLYDVTVVAMDRVHHQVQRRVDNRTRLLRVEVRHQLGRALDIREQRRDRLALALGDGLRIGCHGNADRLSGRLFGGVNATGRGI